MLNLHKEFEQKRQEMVAAGMELGFTHPKTVQLSQELDKLHNQLLRKEAVFMEPRECSHCGNAFTPHRANQKYCTTSCGTYATAKTWRYGDALATGTGQTIAEKARTGLAAPDKLRVPIGGAK